MNAGTTHDSTAEKQALRRRMRAAAKVRTPDTVAAGSRLICDQLAKYVAAKRPRMILLYWPIAGEVDLGGLATACLAHERTVCLPKVRWSEGTLLPVSIPAWDGATLLAGPHGTREPDLDGPGSRFVEPSSLDMVIVPGMAFDGAGGRLGRGGGFYDRLLRSLIAGCAKVGVAFDEQIVERVPMDPWDTPLDVVVTPTRVIWARRA
jgi:5-formyltetrahydrofolate cyclo-ligase